MHLKFFNKYMFYTLGDTHGDMFGLTTALRAIKHDATVRGLAYENTSDVLPVVQLGDFGFVFNGRDERGAVHEACQDLGVALFALRGNHDDPAAWEDNWDGSAAVSGDSGLCMLRDGIYGSVVVVGGAYSIDRTGRVKDLTWYEGELVNQTSVDAIRAIVSDPRYLLLTHEARYLPPGARPGTVERFGGDPAMADAERFKLQQLPRPLWHVHGHWHRRQAYYADDGVPTMCMAHTNQDADNINAAFQAWRYEPGGAYIPASVDRATRDRFPGMRFA